MIKKLRRHIISVTMISLLAAMILLLIVVNVINAAANNSTADSSVERVFWFASFNRQQEAEQIANGEEVEGYGQEFYVVYEDEHSWQRFICVRYDQEGNREQIRLSTYFYIDENSYITEKQVYDYVAKAENSRRDSGWIGDLRFGKFTDENGYGYLVMNFSETERDRIDVMEQASVVTALVSFVVMFAVALFFSDRATRPVVKAVEQQKRFITDASHELKTPITILSANNEIMEINHGEDNLTKSNRTQLDRMSTLIQKMIEMSHFDESIDDVEKERFSLSEAVYDTAMSFESIIEQSGKTISMKLDENVELESDEARVRQLIAILMDNAVKYCDENGKISVKLIKSKRTVLSVENSCSNVDDIALDKLFDRFYREDKVRTGGGGYGLGLSIAESICENCGFDIKAKQSGVAKIMFTVKF